MYILCKQFVNRGICVSQDESNLIFPVRKNTNHNLHQGLYNLYSVTTPLKTPLTKKNKI